MMSPLPAKHRIIKAQALIKGKQTVASRFLCVVCILMGVILSVPASMPAHAISLSNKHLSTAIYDVALAVMTDEKFAEADTLLTQSLLANPANAQAFALKGRAQAKLGHAREGRRFQNLALNIEPDYLQAILWAGEASLKLQDKDDADARLARLSKLCGTCAAFQQLQNALATFDKTRIVAALKTPPKKPTAPKSAPKGKQQNDQ